MACSEGDQVLAGAFHVITSKIEAMLQIADKQNWKCIFIHQGYFFRNIQSINASFGPKYVHLQGWSLKTGQKIKMCQAPLTVIKRTSLKRTSADMEDYYPKPQHIYLQLRSSRPEVFCKKDVLRNFAKLTGKH